MNVTELKILQIMKSITLIVDTPQKLESMKMKK